LELKPDTLAPRFQEILRRCEPYLITYPNNHAWLDLAPFGYRIKDEHLYTATTLRSHDVVEGLHRLDAVSFGGQDMLMPRWVMFDCGEFPGIVFGFGCKAGDLPDYARQTYGATEREEQFVPLSMWIAIRCAEEGAWFGHNLSSGNVILSGEDALSGLAIITKIFGVRVTRATRQYGATQWQSKSIGLHARLGRLEILSSYTPAHTHPETFAYLIRVDEQLLASSLMPDWKHDRTEGDRTFAADDTEALKQLQTELEAGARFELLQAKRVEGAASKIHLRTLKSRASVHPEPKV
jgi:hypothetical protein